MTKSTITYREFTYIILRSQKYTDYIQEQGLSIVRDDMKFAYTIFHQQFGEAPLKAFGSTVQLNSFE